MSDDKTSSFADKAAKAAAIGAGIVGAAAVIPQDTFMKEGLPGIWESIKGIAELSLLRLEKASKTFRPIAFKWGTKLWSVIKWWALVSAALVVAGILVKSETGSNVSHVLVAAGTISFVGLGIALFVLADGIAALLYLKLKIAGSVLGKVTSIVGIDLSKILEEEKKEPKPGQERKTFRERMRLILAGATVLCFSLLFTMFFPAWSTLGWTMCFWAMVGVALTAAVYLDMQMGKAVLVLFYATIALIIGTFVIFILDRLTGGALGFAGFQKWLNARNASQVLTALLIVIPMVLVLVGRLSKTAERKEAFMGAGKYVGFGFIAIFLIFLYAGTISWSDLFGKEPPLAVREVGEKIQNGSIKDISFSKSHTESKEANAAPQGTASHGATYMAPPSGDSAAPDAPARSTSKPQAKKQPLPPLKAKKYKNEADAMADLESLL
jgi:hypothetical protein